MSEFNVGDKVILANNDEVGTGGFADQAGMEADVPMEVNDTSDFGVKLVGYPHPAVEWWSDGRFVLAPEPKFKPGDKVLRTGETHEDVIEGRVYTVHAYNPDADWAELQLEEPARARGDSNIYRNWAARNFEVVTEPVPDNEPKFKAGNGVFFDRIPGLSSTGGSGIIMDVHTGGSHDVYSVKVDNEDYPGTWSFAEKDLSIEEPEVTLSLGDIYNGSSPEALVYVLEQQLGTLNGPKHMTEARRAEVLRSLLRLVTSYI